MLAFLPKLAAGSSKPDPLVSSLLVLALGVAAYAATQRLERSKAKRPHRDGIPLPQPKTTLPILGNTLDFIKNNDVFHDWISDLVQEFGDTPFLLTAPGRPDVLVISTPEAFEDVTKRQFDTFVKGEYLLEMFYDLMGRAITNTDGEEWRFQRKIFAKLFSTRALRESIASTIQSHGREVYDVFESATTSDKQLDLFQLMNRFTMETFAEIGFGIEMNSLTMEEAHPFEKAFDDAQEATAKRFSTPSWVWKLQRLLGVGSEGLLQRSVKILDSTVLGFISESIASRARGDKRTGGAHNIVSLVLDSNDLEGEADPQLLRSIVIAAMIAGRETSAQTLTWFVYMLSQHPEVEKQIRVEMFDKIPTLAKEQGYFPSMDEVQSLTYLEAAIKETLRLYPPASFNIKHCSADTFLSDGTFVPEGTTIGLPSYAMGRKASIWGPDVDVFKPERFLDSETGKLLAVSPFKFPAFFAGPRICVGMNLAMLEMKIVLVGLLSRFHIAVEPGQDVTYVRSLALPMKDPFRVKIERVQAPVGPIA